MHRALRLIVFCCFLTPLTAFGQPDTVKLGYVDLDRALQQLPQAQRAAEALNRELELKQKDLDARREKVQQFQAQLEKQSPGLNEAQRREKSRQLQAMIMALQRSQREAQDELNYKRNQILKDFQDRILRAVAIIGQRGAYTLIVHDKAVLYANKAIDLTDQVVAELRSAKK